MATVARAGPRTLLLLTGIAGKAPDECGRRDIPQDWTVPPFEALYAVDG